MPSEVMKLGDSLDMKCANLALEYENYLNKKNDGKQAVNSNHGYTTEQLQTMVNNVRGKNGRNS